MSLHRSLQPHLCSTNAPNDVIKNWYCIFHNESCFFAQSSAVMTARCKTCRFQLPVWMLHLHERNCSAKGIYRYLNANMIEPIQAGRAIIIIYSVVQSDIQHLVSERTTESLKTQFGCISKSTDNLEILFYLWCIPGDNHVVPDDAVLLRAKCDTQQAFIKAGDMRTLCEGTWLNDQVHTIERRCCDPLCMYLIEVIRWLISIWYFLT